MAMKDTKTGYLAASVVPRKGECGYAAKTLTGFLDFVGYKKVILKSVQEEAILTLKKLVKREWSGEMTFEESAVAESQSNGSIENAVQQIQGMIRTMRDALE